MNPLLLIIMLANFKSLNCQRLKCSTADESLSVPALKPPRKCFHHKTSLPQTQTLLLSLKLCLPSFVIFWYRRSAFIWIVYVSSFLRRYYYLQSSHFNTNTHKIHMKCSYFTVIFLFYAAFHRFYAYSWSYFVHFYKSLPFYFHYARHLQSSRCVSRGSEWKKRRNETKKQPLERNQVYICFRLSWVHYEHHHVGITQPNARFFIIRMNILSLEGSALCFFMLPPCRCWKCKVHMTYCTIIYSLLCSHHVPPRPLLPTVPGHQRWVSFDDSW